MKNVICLFALLAITACASSKKVEKKETGFTEIVKKDGASAKFCPASKDGEACLMTWLEAMSYCESQGAHLPTAREYAVLLMPRGTQILEVHEIQVHAPADFYLVDSNNPDGKRDTFYMNHKNYKRPIEEKGGNLLWTSSIPPLHPQYAHVYYDEWGGGGGNPKDHLLSHRNAVRCAN